MTKHIEWGEFLKKFAIFMVSFLLLYFVFQISSGLILTALYTPNFSSVEGNLGQEVVFGDVRFMPLLITMLIAAIAYFLSQKLFRNVKN